MTELKPGMVVKLISGGPPLTVLHQIEIKLPGMSQSIEGWRCGWFVQGESWLYGQADFSAEALKPFKE